ncbi:MAG: nodulation protein NfeD [bacterium]
MKLTRRAPRLLAFVFLWAVIAAGPSFARSKALVIEVKGTIDPATRNYVARSIQRAENGDFECLVILLDTPGGLMDSMKEMATAMLNTSVPVVVYVYPSGSTATSAGFFLLMASDFAAMSPNTSTGSAHPVAMQGKMDKTMKEKVTNYAVAYMESLTKRRNRNVEWAKKAVTRSVSITEDEALKKKVIEIIADSDRDLLNQLDGRKFVKKKRRVTLHTKNAEIVYAYMTSRERFLHVIAHPNIAYILFIVGVYGIIFEVTHPGAIAPGVIGAIALILAFTAFQVLPINLAGLLFLIGAFIMFILEVKIVSHGLLTLGGTVLMVLGSLMLIDSTDPAFRISIEVVITVALMTAFLFGVALTAVVKTHRRRVTTGAQGMIGKAGKVAATLNPEGKVRVFGEFWHARSEDGSAIEKGSKVIVTGMEGMELTVRKKE